MIIDDYTVVIEALSEEDGGGFLASAKELPGCMSDGETRAEALANLEDAVHAWLLRAQQMGRLAMRRSRRSPVLAS